MRGLYGKISEYQANKIRRAYGAERPYCWRPFKENDVWRLCRGRGVRHVHEIAHGNNRVIHTANLFTLCGDPDGRCHMGYFHREDNPEESDARLMMEAFAVKVIFGEATYDQVATLMEGRNWWTPGMGKTLDVIQACALVVEEMKELAATELPLWQNERTRIVQQARGGDHGE